MGASLLKAEQFYNPIDLAESVIVERDWTCDRLDEGELIAEVNGKWCNYRVWMAWQEAFESLTLSCALDSRVAKQSLPKVYQLLALANERMVIGHFSIGAEDSIVTFRHAILLHDSNMVAPEQLQALLDVAVQECENFYPALQAVMWGSKTPAEAVELALFETIAEA